MNSFRSDKLTKFFQDKDPEKCINFLREIFIWSYTKTRGDDGCYIWFGDRDWDYKSHCPMVDISSCTIIFIDYNEDQVIDKYNRYYKLRGFL
jgi:hypothetical protein